jgi:RimJ/RimL family protein N-acetyltransferase
MIVFSHLPFMKEVACAANVNFVPGHDHGIFRTGSEGQLLGGVLFTDYTGTSAQMHVAGFHQNWLNRELIYVTFDFAFVKLRMKKLIGLVPEANERAFIFDTRIGFKQEAKIEDVFPEGAALILTLSRDECKYLRPPALLREKFGLGEPLKRNYLDG